MFRPHAYGIKLEEHLFFDKREEYRHYVSNEQPKYITNRVTKKNLYGIRHHKNVGSSVASSSIMEQAPANSQMKISLEKPTMNFALKSFV